MSKNPRLIDMTGQKINRWTVKRKVGNHVRGGALWLCTCECGNEREVLAQSLRSGKSKSCGCLKKEKTRARSARHYAAKSRLYICWQNMRRRCRDLTNKKYGGRGITVCDEWMAFIPFRDWAMSAGYSDELTIERIDVDGNYEPSNCTWADASTQAKNRRFIKCDENGEPWFEKARRHGVNSGTFNVRVSAGWDREEAATWPMNTRRKERDRDENGRYA